MPSDKINKSLILLGWGGAGRGFMHKFGALKSGLHYYGAKYGANR